jgi:hypothetical protein
MNAPHKIDVSRGECIGTVSSQWYGRPDDQRFTSLGELRDQVALWAEQSTGYERDPRKLYAFADERGLIIDASGDAPSFAPTHYGFSDVARLAGAPANYLRKLPAGLAADCLNEGFRQWDGKPQQLYIRDPKEGPAAIGRAVTSTKYGRILDRDVVDEVMKLAGNGTGDTRWKVPGVIDWTAEHGVHYNPCVDITKDNTTLYASDRDVFLFLVDDLNPIEVGKLDDGSPDLMFRGFYVWNSEVGSRTFGVATMYLRGVCQNRNLWGVEGFNEVTFRHTSGAPARFMLEAAPALQSYAETAASKLVAGVKAAKEAVVTPGASEEDNEKRIEFLMKLGFSKAKALDLITTGIVEEGRPPESVWDHAQAMSAAARETPYQDDRVKLEQQAGKLLDKVKVPA